MKKVKIKKLSEFSDAEKIKKFNALYKRVSETISSLLEREYGYADLETNVHEHTIEVLFGKSMFKVLDEDNRGDYYEENG